MGSPQPLTRVELLIRLLVVVTLLGTLALAYIAGRA